MLVPTDAEARLSIDRSPAFCGMPLKLQLVDAEAFDAPAAGNLRAGIELDHADGRGPWRRHGSRPSSPRNCRSPRDLMESDDDAPIIRLINAVLTQAVKEMRRTSTSRPYREPTRVRFRIDGVLRGGPLSHARAVAPLVVSRIKVMAKLDIAEKRLPQDGRISLRVPGARSTSACRPCPRPRRARRPAPAGQGRPVHRPRRPRHGTADADVIRRS